MIDGLVERFPSLTSLRFREGSMICEFFPLQPFLSSRCFCLHSLLYPSFRSLTFSYLFYCLFFPIIYLCTNLITLRLICADAYNPCYFLGPSYEAPFLKHGLTIFLLPHTFHLLALYKFSMHSGKEETATVPKPHYHKNTLIYQLKVKKPKVQTHTNAEKRPDEI
ncbi:uncharacterized protein BYT42DRAFT_340510 [Radiomyces spectabilis]|uniref:uncharacterized protein n=1 Tax=Radiomyces spectabilis TaxID=64574 RepID=UPI00222126DC|nr:uncharacterized protein BYT42DRAFT_340510 [Radiomyces spectabilis]KAI8379785.1 hypothetical protein BYT42DRAFT_340510 [Radiomyces spectabilis]